MMRRFPSLALISLWISTLAASGLCFGQDAISDCVVSQNGICLDGTLGKAADTTVPAASPKPTPVVFQGGQLEINSQSSSLKEILTAIGSLTGVEIEMPSVGLEERVVAHLGPGSTRDVLVDLLNGSSFNYVMVASPKNPGILQKLVLTNRGAQAPAEAASIPQPPPGNADENNGPQLYGQGFSTDPNASSNNEPEPTPAPAAKEADWAHTQGHLLDQMQKQRIKEREEQQEQQQQANPQPQ